MTKIIAIDPSINETGWAITDVEGRILSGVIKTKGKTDTEKLFSLRVQLLAILLIEPIFHAVIECPESFSYGRSTGKNGKQLNTASLMKLSRAVGVILVTFAEEGILTHEITPKWKGKLNKELAKTISGKKNHNEADAICLLKWFQAGENG